MPEARKGGGEGGSVAGADLIGLVGCCGSGGGSEKLGRTWPLFPHIAVQGAGARGGHVQYTSRHCGFLLGGPEVLANSTGMVGLPVRYGILRL